MKRVYAVEPDGGYGSGSPYYQVRELCTYPPNIIVGGETMTVCDGIADRLNHPEYYAGIGELDEVAQAIRESQR